MSIVALPIVERGLAIVAIKRGELDMRGHVSIVVLDVLKDRIALWACVLVPSLQWSWEKGLIDLAPSSSRCKLNVLRRSLRVGENCATCVAFVVHYVGHWCDDTVLSSQRRKPLVPPQCIFGGESHTAEASTVR